MFGRFNFPILLVVAASVLGVGATDRAPQPVRTILQQHDQSEVPGKIIVIGTAALPSGTTIPYHTHPGDEIGYVLKGSLTLKTRGQPDRHLKAGDSFFNPRDAIHSLTASTDEPGAAVSTWIVDKDKPLATAAPE